MFKTKEKPWSSSVHSWKLILSLPKPNLLKFYNQSCCYEKRQKDRKKMPSSHMIETLLQVSK